MRQDPDLIMLGEMSDAETIATAITAAESGHLVLASLYSKSAVQAISRLIDIFPPEQRQQLIVQLANCMQAILSQQLVPKADGNGRVPAVEVLLTSLKVRELIRKSELAKILDVMEASNEAGMVSMDQSLRRLYAEDKISLAEADKRIYRHEMP